MSINDRNSLRAAVAERQGFSYTWGPRLSSHSEYRKAPSTPAMGVPCVLHSGGLPCFPVRVPTRERAPILFPFALGSLSLAAWVFKSKRQSMSNLCISCGAAPGNPYCSRCKPTLCVVFGEPCEPAYSLDLNPRCEDCFAEKQPLTSGSLGQTLADAMRKTEFAE